MYDEKYPTKSCIWITSEKRGEKKISKPTRNRICWTKSNWPSAFLFRIYIYVHICKMHWTVHPRQKMQITCYVTCRSSTFVEGEKKLHSGWCCLWECLPFITPQISYGMRATLFTLENFLLLCIYIYT